MWLLVGLGNPGDEHAKHRHNIGFMVLDAIADETGFPAWRSKFQGEMSEGKVGGDKVVLLKPQTYMNESGQSVGKAAKFYKISPEKIVVFHDELDLKNATVRIKKGGGNAGHNGLRSIQDHLSTPDFWRARIGIGHPGDKNRVSGYVLSDFAKADQDWVEAVINGLANSCDLIVSDGPEAYGKKISEALSAL
ncbi:MAG: peptidyl-tRNA hydrolase [Micavibrio sp.]|nr:MAG: peptidyl-tRNA hydrolase [Micavibrio sp.]